MTESPDSTEAKRIVDDLEDDIVDVDKAEAQAGDAGEQAEDVSEETPGSPEPTD